MIELELVSKLQFSVFLSSGHSMSFNNLFGLGRPQRSKGVRGEGRVVFFVFLCWPSWSFGFDVVCLLSLIAVRYGSITKLCEGILTKRILNPDIRST